MAATRIIEALHVLKDCRARFAPSRKLPLMNQLGLQGREETLHDGIVPTVARSTHGTVDVPRQESLLVARGGILAAAV